MRLGDKLALVALVILAIVFKFSGIDNVDSGSSRRPDPGQFAPLEPLTPASPSEPGIVVPVGHTQANSSGTAFSIDSSGVWITARHVADGCDRILLQKTGRQFVQVNRVRHHTNADISILWTRNGVPALPMSQQKPRPNQDGYSFGFPKGEPGDVHARLIGRTKMHQHGRYRTNEPVVAWTQIRRTPDRGAHLGGISGGPWVDAEGRILGVHIAGNPRRGRSYATAPASLRTAFTHAGLTNSSAPRNFKTYSVTPQNFPTVGNRLRNDLTVVKVLCLVGERWRTGKRRR